MVFGRCTLSIHRSSLPKYVGFNLSHYLLVGYISVLERINLRFVGFLRVRGFIPTKIILIDGLQKRRQETVRNFKFGANFKYHQCRQNCHPHQKGSRTFQSGH